MSTDRTRLFRPFRPDGLRGPGPAVRALSRRGHGALRWPPGGRARAGAARRLHRHLRRGPGAARRKPPRLRRQQRRPHPGRRILHRAGAAAAARAHARARTSCACTSARSASRASSPSVRPTRSSAWRRARARSIWPRSSASRRERTEVFDTTTALGHRRRHRGLARRRHSAGAALPAHDHRQLSARSLAPAAGHGRRDRRHLRLGLPRASTTWPGEITRFYEAREQKLDFQFDRRFIFQVLSMGHAQFAELLGIRGPNTQVNSACASTTVALGIAEDWIRTGRCRRVVIIGADELTSDNLLEWMGAGFVATGAATTEDVVERAALPFDRRRHGMLMGMGACGLVVESEDAVRERGMRGLVEVLGTEFANSAFHGTRLDVTHIEGVMEKLVASVERTPRPRSARDGQGAGLHLARDLHARARRQRLGRGVCPAQDLRSVGQRSGRGQHQGLHRSSRWAWASRTRSRSRSWRSRSCRRCRTSRSPIPSSATLNLSKGGHYPVRFALRLAAGFGSQIAMSLFRRVPGVEQRIADQGDVPALAVGGLRLRQARPRGSSSGPCGCATRASRRASRRRHAGRRGVGPSAVVDEGGGLRRGSRPRRRLSAPPAAAAGGHARPRPRPRPREVMCWRRCSGSWRRRRGIRGTCWIWISIWRRIWASTRSSRRRCSRWCGRPSGFLARTT